MSGKTSHAVVELIFKLCSTELTNFFCVIFGREGAFGFIV